MQAGELLIARQLLSAAMVVYGMAFSPALSAADSPPDLKCSPPVRVDLSLDMSVVVQGGLPPHAGTSGQIVFTVRHLGTGNAHPFFMISHVPFPISGEEQPDLELQSMGSSDCSLSLHFEPPDNPIARPSGYYYMLGGPRLHAGETAQCRVRFAVGADAVVPTALAFSVSPRDCHTDVDWSDNSARLVFGNPLPAAVPLLNVRGRDGLPGLMSVVVGILMLAGWRMRP